MYICMPVHVHVKGESEDEECCKPWHIPKTCNITISVRVVYYSVCIYLVNVHMCLCTKSIYVNLLFEVSVD